MILSGCEPLPEQISFGRSNKIASAPESVRYRHALQNGCGHAIELAHYEPAGSREFVGNGNHSRLEHRSMRVALSSIIDQRYHSRHAHRAVDQSLAPRSPACLRTTDGHGGA